jgi:hypothetical protein
MPSLFMTAAIFLGIASNDVRPRPSKRNRGANGRHGAAERVPTGQS